MFLLNKFGNKVKYVLWNSIENPSDGLVKDYISIVKSKWFSPDHPRELNALRQVYYRLRS